MIPTAGAANVRPAGRRWLPSGLVLGFLVSGALHAVVLGWGEAHLGLITMGDPTGQVIAVRLVDRSKPAQSAAQRVPQPAPVVQAEQPVQAMSRATPHVMATTQPATVVAAGLQIAPQAARRDERPVIAPAALAKFGGRSDPSAEGAVVEAPDYRERIRVAAQRLQRYPNRARQLGLEGTAVVALEPGAEPRVELAGSSGFAILDRAAVDLIARAAREARPAEKSSGTLRFPVRYDLLDEKR
jgi:TonB family protein